VNLTGGTYYWAAFGPHTETYYRSIGTAADLVDQGTLTLTAGSMIVTGSGTSWKAANRGRGDRLTVGTNHYMILGVASDTQLTLASPAVVSYTGSTYTIARQFTIFQGWENCVSRSAANTCKRPADTQEYFATTSSSLVADDRREIGIAYKDSVFTPSAQVLFVGATTETTHTIMLTADGINRHNGVAGAGVVIDGAGANRGFRIEDNNYTVEWLEFARVRGTNDIAAVLIRGGGTSQTGVLLQNLLIHDFFDATNDIKGIGVQGNGGKVATIRNVMIWNGDLKGIEGDAVNDTITIENCTIDGMTYGIDAWNSQFTVRNTIVTSTVVGHADFWVDDVTGSMSGSHNTSSDTTAQSGPRVTFTNFQTNVTAASIMVAPNSDLHLLAGANSQVDAGLDLSSRFAFDIDGQLRPGGVWDRGADERDGTTEVKLQSFAAVPGDGSVTLEWRTGSELDNLGFHVYRGHSADGPWTRLTSSLIPGLGSSPLGQAYSWLDSGLVNGTRYYYRLEDVDTSSVSTFHGPVSAVPLTAPSPPGGGGGDGGGGDGAEGGEGEPGGASCPTWVLAASLDAVSPRCTRHGDPDSVSFDVLSRDASSATLELRTGGFWALHETSGTVRVFVSGLEFPTDARAPALPLRRALVDAVVGKEVELVSAEALEVQSFRELRPGAVGAPEVAVGRNGTVRPARRSLTAPLLSRGYVPREVARLAGTVFQGERKSAVVEIVPVRFSGSGQELVLAGRVRVRLAFTGVASGESGTGSRGRAFPGQRVRSGEVLAQMHTSRRGLHAVSYEALFPQRPRGFSTVFLRLQRQGEAVPFHVEPSGPVFGPGKTLYFFADRTASSTDYSSEVAYELVRSSGVEMGVALAPPVGTPGLSSSTGFASFETNRIYQPGLLEAPDLWLWDWMGSGVTRSEGFTLSGVDTASSELARLVAHLQGGSESGFAVDHHLRLSVNGASVGETSFAGKQPHKLEVFVAASLLKEGANELSLTNVGDTGVVSGAFLDRFEISYGQASTVRQGVFEGVWRQSGTVEVAGLSGAPVVLDVTGAGPVILRDARLPGPEGSAVAGAIADSSGRVPFAFARNDSTVRWVTGFQTSFGSVRFRAEAGRRYLVVSPEGLLSPRVGQMPLSTLREGGNQADYLVIAPQELLEAATPLLERRRSQGLSSRAVSFEEIASEFGHAQPSAEAIRAFVCYAYHSWQRPSPRYVLLLGDATYDPRRFVGSSWASPLPALWTKTSYLWTVSDPALGAVNGEDLLPDIAIGRLPATTAEQAEALVSKLLAWEDSGQGLSGNAVLVADKPDQGGDFEADVEDVRTSFLGGRGTTTLRVSELGVATRPAILDSFDEGASLMSYVGHGGTAVWSSSNVLSSWDAASLRAQSRQPLLLTMNCLNGYFVAPNFDALPEALLKAEGRGAIAAFSPSGLSLDGPAHQYHRAVVAELVSGQHERLGDAILAAQRTYAQTGLMPELLTVYQLLGDPAMRVR
jgi:hypothetical protein